jgi:lipopolysaccharide transport system permease protein
MLKMLWDYRSFIIGSIRREFQSQYKKSLLGTLWVIMNPLYMCVIYTIILSSVMRSEDNKVSYSIYVAAGLLAWNFFLDIFTRSQRLYLNYNNIIKKQRFPLACLPLIVVGLAWIDFFISFGLFSLYLVAVGHFPGWCYLAIIPLLFLQTMLAIGWATSLGMLNIFFQDVERGLAILLQVWFWLTPIVYFVEKLPPTMQSLIMLNPLTAIMHAYQTVLANQQWPEWHTLFYPLVITIITLSFLSLFYQKNIVEIMDEL